MERWCLLFPTFNLGRFVIASPHWVRESVLWNFKLGYKRFCSFCLLSWNTQSPENPSMNRGCQFCEKAQATPRDHPCWQSELSPTLVFSVQSAIQGEAKVGLYLYVKWSLFLYLWIILHTNCKLTFAPSYIIRAPNYSHCHLPAIWDFPVGSTDTMKQRQAILMSYIQFSDLKAKTIIQGLFDTSLGWFVKQQ